MKIGIYCRVSTDKQKDNESLGLQKRRGIEFAKKMGFEYEVYEEIISGGKIGVDREEFKKLEDKVWKKEIKGIWFWDWDRMIRDVEVMVYFRNLVKDTNIKVYVRDEEKNIFDDSGSLEYGFRSIIADYERRRIKERLKSGKIEKWERGEGFSGQVGFGWKRDENAKVVVDDKKAEIVRFIYKSYLRKDVRTMTEVFDRVMKRYGNNGKLRGLSHVGRISDILKDEKYVSGKYNLIDEDGREWIFDFGSIIDKDVFRLVRDKVEKNRKIKVGIKKEVYALSGKLECGYCNSNMIIRTGGSDLNRGGRGKGRYRFYYCSLSSKKKYDKRNYNEVRDGNCESEFISCNNISKNKIEEIVWRSLFMFLESSDEVKEEYKKRYNKKLGLKEDNKGRLKFYYNELEKLENKKSKLFKFVADDKLSVDDYNDWKKNEYEVGVKEYNGKIKDLEEELSKVNEDENVDDYLKLMNDDLKNRFNNDRVEHRRRIINQYIEKVIVWRKDVKGIKNYRIKILFKIGNGEDEIKMEVRKNGRIGNVLGYLNDIRSMYIEYQINKQKLFVVLEIEVVLFGKSKIIVKDFRYIL